MKLNSTIKPIQQEDDNNIFRVKEMGNNYEGINSHYQYDNSNSNYYYYFCKFQKTSTYEALVCVLYVLYDKR